MSKLCISCNEPIHPKRLEILPTANRCVSCSTTNKKAGVTVTKGTGDHTYNETIIVDHDDFTKIQEIEFKINGKRKDDIPHPDDEDDEDDIIEIDDEIDPIELK
jgi:hypothetical protein